MDFVELTTAETDAVSGGNEVWEAAARAAKEAAIAAAKAAMWLNEQLNPSD